jgi:hypothetical protein
MSDDDLRTMVEAWRQESAAAHAETRRLFSETAERIAADNRHFFGAGADGLRGEVKLVAEGVAVTREVLARESAEMREEMRRGFAETQAMVKFSHAELDRRVRALEESQRTTEQTLADVQARLERLESSTR